VAPGLRKGSLVDDPDFRLTEKINHLMRQATLDFLDGPGTLSHKLTPRLHVGPFNTARHRFDRLAFPIAEQALPVDERPVSPFAAPPGFEQILKQMHQPGPEPFQGLQLQAAQVTERA
jgi:hypothetical protein